MSKLEDEGAGTMTKHGGAASNKRQGIFYAFNRAVNGTLERLFDALGRFIARRPILVIVLSLVVAGALGSGITQLRNETRGEKLWIPDDNESQRSSKFVNEYFPSTARLELFQLRREDGGNMLTPAAFDKFFEIHNRIINASYPNNDKHGELPATIRFMTLCLNLDSTEGAAVVTDCRMNNPAEIFSYDASRWATTEGILSTLNDRQQWDEELTGQGFTLDQVLGGLVQNGAELQSAEVLGGFYFLAGNETLREQQKEDEAAQEWEQVFLDILEEEDLNNAEYVISRLASRSFDDEFSGQIDADIALLQVAIICIIIFTAIALSNFKDGFVGLRVALTLGGMVNVGISILAAYGLASYMGLLFTPLMQILPFIMVGIGVDGMFVLTSALDHTDEALSLEDRMGQAMSEGAVSVFVASFTNFGAFIIGSNTTLPALGAFSIYAALALLFNLIFQITFFVACMAIDKRRQINRRVDCCCCLKCGDDTIDQGICSGYLLRGIPSKRLSVVVMSWLGRQYTKWPVKVGVLTVYLGLLVAGIYGTSQIRVDADVNDFVPENSYLKEFLFVQEEYFAAAGTTAEIYWTRNKGTPETPVDFTTAEVQQQMDRSLQLYSSNEYVTPGTLDSWWVGFKEFKNNTMTPATFYEDLNTYLAGAGQRYAGDVVFVEEGEGKGTIFAARSEVTWRFLEESSEKVKALDSFRAIDETLPAPLGPNTFPFSTDFLDIEQYKSIGREAVMNISLGFAMIGVVILILVANPVASVIAFINVASAIVELIGFMYFRGTYIDSVSVIFLVISLGLAVDYSVHVASGYLAVRIDDPAERLAVTMETTGSAVVNGAISTLIAALCLAGSESYVFLTFFFALLFIVLAGAFQGLVVEPVMLDIFRPPYNVFVVHEPANTDSTTDASNVGNKVDGPTNGGSPPV